MQRVSGWTEQGGVSVVISGTPGSDTQTFQQSSLGATVTVYDAGTLNAATIYDDDAGTAKANPFTASSTTGYWSFYVAPGDYDIAFTSIDSPFTLGDVSVGLGDSGGVPSYAFASLPTSAAYQAGRLARVTDTSRGLWMDTGTQWTRIGNPHVTVFDAVGDNAVTDDTTALQAAINWFKDPSLSNLPGASDGLNAREFRGRVLDLGGKIYGVSSPLDLTNAYGLKLCNGALIAIGAGWGASDSILEGNLTTNLHLQDLVLEGNAKANCIYITRPINGMFRDIALYGFGTLSWGFKHDTSFAGLGLRLINIQAQGDIAARATTFTPTATAFKLEGGSDSMIAHCDVVRCLVGIEIQGGGWHIDNNHLASTGMSDKTPATGLLINTGSLFNHVVGNQFDGSFMHLKGSQRLTCVGNTFRQDNSGAQAYAILWEATSASQTLGDAVIQSNLTKLAGTAANFNFISLDQSGGNTFDVMRHVLVKDNPIRQQSALPAGLINPSATEGTIDLDIPDATGTYWTGTDTVVDLSSYILHPTPATDTPVFQVTGWSVEPDSGTPTLQDFAYAHASGKLTLTFSAAFAGRASISYRYGPIEKTLTAQAS